jgi:hypothetical protein
MIQCPSFVSSLWHFLKLLFFSLHAMVFGSLSPKLWDLDSRLGGCGIRGIDYLFFQISLKDKEDYRLMGPSARFSDSV